MKSSYDIALERYQQAEQNFNYADSDCIDAAIYELKAAEELLKVERQKKSCQSSRHKKDSKVILPWITNNCQI
jgi:hypothetical protein